MPERKELQEESEFWEEEEGARKKGVPKRKELRERVRYGRKKEVLGRQKRIAYDI